MGISFVYLGAKKEKTNQMRTNQGRKKERKNTNRARKNKQKPSKTGQDEDIMNTSYAESQYPA
jgi:hypothetical protein